MIAAVINRNLSTNNIIYPNKFLREKSHEENTYFSNTKITTNTFCSCYKIKRNLSIITHAYWSGHSRVTVITSLAGRREHQVLLQPERLSTYNYLTKEDQVILLWIFTEVVARTFPAAATSVTYFVMCNRHLSGQLVIPALKVVM